MRKYHITDDNPSGGWTWWPAEPPRHLITNLCPDPVKVVSVCKHEMVGWLPKGLSLDGKAIYNMTCIYCGFQYPDEYAAPESELPFPNPNLQKGERGNR
jgi:hypothetical protein